MIHYFAEQFGLPYAWLAAFFIQFTRYVLLAGGVFLFFYVIRKKKWRHRKIQPQFPKNKHLINEIKYSALSLLIIAGLAISVYLLNQAGYTQIYTDPKQYGWAYLFFSIPLLLFIHDTYFYWTHRLMHAPKIYKIVHRVHHISHNPSPWAAFSFHPLEAFIEAGIIYILLILPVHPLALLIFSTLSLGMNIIGHLGYEIFPKGFLKHPLGRWHNTSTHHNMHHQLVKCNYGLYFNFWDTWMGTNHPQYFERFEEVKNQKENAIEGVL